MSFAETELGDGSFFQAQAVLSSRIGSGGLGGGHLNELIFGTAAGQNSKNESSIVLSLAVPPNCFCSDPQGWGPFDGEYRFTSCFIDGVVLQFPNILLLIVGLYQIYVFSQRKPRVGTMKWNGWLKMLLSFIALSLIASRSPNPTSNIAFWGPVSTAIVLVVATLLHYIEQFRAFIPSASLLLFWPFQAIALIFKVQNLAVHHKFQTNFWQSCLYAFALVNSVILFLVEDLVKPEQTPYERVVNQHRSPMETADIYSRMTFTWMSPLMKLGGQQYLEEEDLPELPKAVATTVATEAFEEAWNYEIEHRKKPSLTWALGKAFGAHFLIGGMFKAIQDLLAFSQPQLLRILIVFVNDYNDPTKDIRLAKGVYIALAMFIISVIQTLSLHQYFQRAFETGMNLRSSLIAAIFRKSLVLCSEARGEKSTGDIVNLMSVDTQRLQDLTQYGQTIWSGPLQILLCLASLYQLLGNSMWAGVTVMVVMIPLNSYIAKFQKILQQKQMKTKDTRTRLTSEILTSVKSLKLYGWEIPFIKRLNEVRNNQELKTLKQIGFLSAGTTALWSSAPFLVSCSTFAVFVYTNDQPLSSDIVFPALTLFNLLSFPLAVVPAVISALIEASVSVHRLSGFLTAEELQNDAVTHLPKATEIGEKAVTVENATFLWQRRPEYKVALSNVDFVARKGELSCIVGRVGCGKSALLQSILGDLHKTEGQVTVKGKVAYVAQTPWIMNASVKENILFGHKLDPEFYQRTIEACALIDEFAILPDGDNTSVGEKGISLSGGQRARLSLARAVYARADVYLLDDPLSAVDEHVGRHIIDNVLIDTGLLASKTIILATNSIPVLSHADSITMIVSGKIHESGSVEEVMEARGAIYDLINEFGKRPKSGNGSDASSATALDDIVEVEGEETPPADPDAVIPLTCGSFEPKKKIRRESTHTIRRASTASFTKPRNLDHEDADKNQFKEHSEQGKVKWEVYREYARASDMRGVFGFLFFLLVSAGLSMAANVWLKYWSDINSRANFNPHVGMYLGVYVAFGIGSALFASVQTIVLIIYCAIHSAKYLHDKMLTTVMRAPMSFFETTPVGRIINRFSNDIYRVDQVLARTFQQFFSNSVKVLFTLIVISFSTPQFLFLVIPLLFLYLYYQRFYLRTSRELKRLDSVSKSPIYAHFQETLGGISTVRAYGQQNRFEYINESRIDLNLKAYFPTVSANRWLAVRLEFIGAVIIFATAGFSLISLKNGHLSPGLIGLAMSYALQITQSLNWIVRMTVEVETNIVSVERILEYCSLESEAPEIIENHRPPAAWPSDGSVEFIHYSTRYRDGLPLALKNINLNIKPREKIGIVGRTGAGKSSLTLALFRIIEPDSGQIDIDNINTSAIGLSDLRHRLSIIPQDSQVFEGTIRDNLDPEGLRDDTELWRALELSHLKSHIESMPGGLEAKVSEGGSNLSVGQRQLMCLARALLTPSNILVLDEATAAVDVETDHVIQETIRSEFSNRTILTIAHRLNTIMDSDRIVVLSGGEVAEFDTPANLLLKEDSLFYSLAKQGGFVES